MFLEANFTKNSARKEKSIVLVSSLHTQSREYKNPFVCFLSGRHFTCQKNLCSNIVTRLRKGEGRKITVYLATKEFEQTYDPSAPNNITISVRSANQEKQGTTENNHLNLLFDLKVEADLRLHTLAGMTLFCYKTSTLFSFLERFLKN